MKARGYTRPTRSAGNFLSCPSTPPLFKDLRVQLVVSVERFRDGQYSMVSLSYAVHLLTVLPVSSHL